ncbi:MAG: hypothetical protein EZS28_036282, partial [Streblomastix strix]
MFESFSQLSSISLYLFLLTFIITLEEIGVDINILPFGNLGFNQSCTNSSRVDAQSGDLGKIPQFSKLESLLLMVDAIYIASMAACTHTILLINMELELPKNQDVNIMKKTDEECGKDQQFKVLSPAKPVTMIELKAIQQKFKLYQGIGIISQDQIKLRTEVLRIARCVEAGYLSEVNEDMLTIIQELTNYAANLLHNTINNYEDIEFLFQNGFFIELLDLIRRTHVDKIPDETLRT